MASKTTLLLNDDVLIRDDSFDPLGGRTKEAFLDAVQRYIAGRVLEAYICGSFTTGRFSKDSDIDLILVTQTERPFHKRFLDFEGLFDLAPALDLLIYTPQEFAEMRRSGDCGFWKSVFSTAVKIL